MTQPIKIVVESKGMGRGINPFGNNTPHWLYFEQSVKTLPCFKPDGVTPLDVGEYEVSIAYRTPNGLGGYISTPNMNGWVCEEQVYIAMGEPKLPPIKFDSNLLHPDNYDENENFHTCKEISDRSRTISEIVGLIEGSDIPIEHKTTLLTKIKAKYEN